MAIISDMQEEEVPSQQHQPAAAATGAGDVDLDVLAAVLERKGGALPFLQAAIDVARRRSDLFRDPSAVGKVTAMASAARTEVEAEERRVREAKRKAEEAEEAERVAAGKEKVVKAAAAAAAERMESSVVTEDRAAESSGEKGNNTEVEQEGSKARRRKIKILETKGWWVHVLGKSNVLCQNYPYSFHRLLHKMDGKRAEWEYSFAVAGVNISYMLVQMLDLKSGNMSTKNGACFVRLLEGDEMAFDNLQYTYACLYFLISPVYAIFCS